MKIPITNDDLTNGAFTSLARYIGRHWPEGDSWGLSLAQNNLAKMFGYRDYHDIQQSACASLNPSASDFERELASIRDNMTSNFGLTVAVANALVGRLPLKKMSFAFGRTAASWSLSSFSPAVAD